MSAQDENSPRAEPQTAIEELNAKLTRKTEQEKIIQQISSEINSSLDLENLLEIILNSMDAVLGFKHGMILLADSSEETLRLAANRGYEDAGIGAEVKLGQGVIGVAAKRRRMMRMGNIQSQMTYLSAVRSQVAAAGRQDDVPDVAALPGLPGVQSQIAIPLVIKKRLVGVFAVESAEANAFDELDEILLSIVANQVAAAIDNSRLHQDEVERSQQLDKAVAELSRLNETLESKVEERTAELSSALADIKREKQLTEDLLNRMAPPEVIPLMLQDKLSAGKIKTTILFSDLENFTEFTSGMEPDEIFSRLNHYFSWAGEIINRYRGYINKTNGDGIMALFGVPFESGTHATDAVLAALNLQRESRDHFPLNMRVGISTGTITAGMLGPKNKSLYDVLGDPVNIASRMESISPSGGITISRDTHDLVKPYFEIESMGEKEVKGLRLVSCFQVAGVQKLLRDGRRVDATSSFAANCAAFAEEVEDVKRRQLSMIDFLSIQSRDGALNHNEAVAAYALALLRALKEGAGAVAAAALDGVDENTLIRAALLHDIGKYAIASETLNQRSLGDAERDRLRDDMLTKTVATLERVGAGAVAPAIENLYRFERSAGDQDSFDPMTEILAAADIYDAMTAPKLYKGTSWRITGALEELLHLPYCQASDRPIVQAFVDMMRPKDASISIRTSTKVVIR